MVKLTLVHLLSMTCGAQRDPWSESFLRTTSVCKLPSPRFHSLSALSVPFSPSQPWSTRRQVALLASLLLHAPAYLHLASLRLFLAQIRRLLLLLLPLPGPWCGLPPCRRRLGGASSSCHGGMPALLLRHPITIKIGQNYRNKLYTDKLYTYMGRVKIFYSSPHAEQLNSAGDM